MLTDFLHAMKEETSRSLAKLERLERTQGETNARKPSVIIRPHNRWGKTITEAKEKHTNPVLAEAEAIIEQSLRIQ